MTTKPKSTLRLLAEAILGAVDRIEDRFETAGLDFPSLNDPLDPTHPSTALVFNSDVADDATLIVAATEQLTATVRHPALYVLENALAFNKSSCLRTASVTNIPDILREAGPQGLHVNDIAKKNGMDPEKIARVLRVLATHHIFTEVEPNVFANNRTSSVLVTSKSTSELFSKPRKEKHVGATGVAALIELTTDEHFKTSAYMTEALTDPKTSHSDSPTETAFNRAFNTTDGFWTWLGRPENVEYSVRFNMAMKKVSDFGEKGKIHQGFPWDSLPEGSKVVDVGGGIGSVSMLLAERCPKLNFVVQDLPYVVKGAEKFWNERIPGSIDSGRVVIQEHDFFTPQPVKDADLFLLRAITHDWSASYAKKILRHLRDAAVIGKTRLLVLDQVLSHVCKPPPITESSIEMPAPQPVPEFLLPNLGRASGMTYLLDVQVLTALQGQERTIGQHIEITSESGWKITRVYHLKGTAAYHILAVPV